MGQNYIVLVVSPSAAFFAAPEEGCGPCFQRRSAWVGEAALWWLLPAEREPTLIFNLQPRFGVGGDVPFCLDFGKMQIVVCCTQLSNKSIIFTGKTEDLLVL